MIILHDLNDSRSQRVIWLLKELELEFEVKEYKRDPKTMRAPKSLKAAHPLGLAPVLEDGPVKLAETGAIFQYLLDKYDVEGKLHPLPGTEKYNDYIYWLHFAEGTLMPPLLIRLLLNKTVEKVPLFIKPFAMAISKGIEVAYVGDQINRLFSFMNQRLGENKYFLGSEFSAVDIMMSFPLEASKERVNLESYPNVKGFLKLIEAD